MPLYWKQKNFNESIVMVALKQGLHSNWLIFFFNKNYLDTYEQILVHIQKYAQAEEKESILYQAKKEKSEKK